ncbi:membrane progestin receptor gamma-B isoform X3 [Hippocampus comes]|uniref:membrane progestin receptor gamma-B isoform X3 n=1 Tax=Hippocampus comes TaxID=109280 RepID=UPI00094EF2AF|nr:PREDICTED: membrane progestin receptor gamma isoform X3 [Hippocampus comes]
METGKRCTDTSCVAAPLHLASGGLNHFQLHISIGIKLCSHLQQHVGAGATHVLLFGLRSHKSLQPGHCYFVFSLCVPRQVGKPLLPPVLCPCCSSERHRMHWLGVLLQVWLGLPFRHHNQDVLKRFPKCQSPRFSKVLRLVAFAYPYLFDHIPLFYRLFLCEGEGCTDNDANVLHYTHIALAFLTGFLFATHLPERLAPGSFDFIGNSHQLFHVFGILGTRFQMMAVEQDMVLRRPWLLDHSRPITFANSLGVTLLCLMVNLSILLLFSLPLLSAKVGQQKKHKRQIKAH